MRASSFLPQLLRRPRWHKVDARRHLSLFLVGFFKKACIADGIAHHVDLVFADPSLYSVGSVWIAVLLYAVQIYCDFSGYTDMAIATAGLLGYDLGRNFAFSYLAASLPELWHRWHISLSTWLRDYLYIPLGGSRGSRLGRTIRNLLLTMLLGGLWHGAAWTFVAWGALHGAGLAVDRSIRWLAADRGLRLPGLALLRPLAVGATFYFVCCSWILFRATSFSDAWTLLRAFVLLDGEGTLTLDPRLAVLFVALAAVHWLASRWSLERGVHRLPEPAFAVAYGAATALVVAFLPLRTEPFIYFQF